ncbi:hypothetical protein [Effusibacillus lacus]|nr:hypothetical protein [Effusibacillus lacus]
MNLIGEFIGTGLNTSLYSTLLDQWLNAPSPEILGGTFENLRFV